MMWSVVLFCVFICWSNWVVYSTPTVPISLPTAQPTFFFPSVEYNALFDLYNSTDGENWQWKDVTYFGKVWRFGSGVDPCSDDWQGLTCNVVDGTQYITEIKLNGYRMVGKLPASVANFSQLVNLNLSHNALLGTLPPSLGQLKNLNGLLLNFNSFDGTIPVELTNCSALTQLMLNHNNFVGTIPKEISLLRNLKSLNLEQNNLVGTIPSDLDTLSDLEILALNQNSLQGTIPESLSNLQHLINLELNNNFFNGTLPHKLGYLPRVQVFVLQDNELTGTIPSTFGSLTTVRNLNLGSNQLKGTIPDQLGNLTSLRALDISFNLAITGTLPEALSQLSELSTLYLNGNFLFGTIPAKYALLTNMLIFDVSSNFLSGPLPKDLASWSDLTTLSLSGNDLTGTLPIEIFSLSKLNKLLLNYNHLNGTIPFHLGNVTSLSELDLSNNSFTGNIPVELGQLYRLTTFSLASNSLTSSIPSEICSLSRLTTLSLNDNLLIGNIPRAIKNMTVLGTINLYGNYLTGSLPVEMAELKALSTIHVSDNLLSHSLPEWLGDLLLLQDIAVESNMFTGSIPASIYNLTLLNILTVFENQLTGTLPYQLTQSVNKILQYVAVNLNDLTGTIPTDLDNLKILETFDIKGNHYTGTIPESVGNTTFLRYLDLSQNSLSGTLPTKLQDLHVLQALFVDENLLTGSLNSFVNSSKQPIYTNIDVSNNFFVGAIPTEPFKINTFETFAAVGNCLTGFIPRTICEASALTSLALDGISTATSCRHRYLRIKGLPHTYGLKYSLKEGIPDCLFNMSLLQTLHLSGNGITGSLSGDLVISPSLVDLSLSYNVLSGTIPASIQSHKWSNLDLSYNKFTGELIESLVDPLNSPYTLKVNRLSGVLPSSILNATNISVLTGNIFTCGYSHQPNSQLPTHDEDANTYSCGSNTANVSLFVWSGVAAIGLVVLLGCYFADTRYFPILRWIKKKLDLLAVWLAVFKAPTDAATSTGAAASDADKEEAAYKEESTITNIHILGIFMNDLRRMFVLFSLFMMLIATPVYVGLSFSYNTYYHEYAWSLAATYLSGFAPAFIILCICAAILIFVIYQSIVSIKFKMEDFYRRLSRPNSEKFVYTPLAWLTVIAVINITISVGLNVGYVLITVNYGSSVVVSAQLCLAVFKVIWNETVLRCVIFCCKHYNELNGEPYKNISLLLPLCLLLFNGIVCPCLATLLLSPDCFASVIVAPAEVTASYSYSVCDAIQTNSRSVCTSYTSVTASTSYLPPFNYSYQCSSSLVANYASVYVFIFLIKTFALPLALLTLRSIDLCVHKAGAVQDVGWCSKMFSGALPDFLRSIEQLEDLKKPRFTLFFKEIFAIRSIYIFGILLTFGVMFPPIAFVATVNIFSQTYCTQFILGRLIVSADKRGVGKKYRTIIEGDCHELPNLFWSSIYPLIPLVSIFYSFFVYDTYGDVVGWKHALWLVLLTMFMPLIILLVFYLYQWRFPMVRRIVKRRATRARSSTILTTVSRFSVFKLSMFSGRGADDYDNEEDDTQNGDTVERTVSKEVEMSQTKNVLMKETSGAAEQNLV